MQLSPISLALRCALGSASGWRKAYRNEEHQQGNAEPVADLQFQIDRHTGNVGVRHIGTIDEGYRVKASQDWEQTPVNLVPVGSFPSVIRPVVALDILT